MKRVIFTSLSLAMLFTACKKESISEENSVPEAIQLPNTTSAAYVSDWEGVNSSAWTSTATNDELTYEFNKTISQVNTGVLRSGVVMAFAKGYNFADANMNKPMNLPFTFFLPYERMAFPYNWNYDKQEGSVKVGLTMKRGMQSEFLAAQNNIKMRYVVISPAYFAQTGTDAATLSRLSYNELMAKLNVNP
ncbi:MAG: hypothetical protein JWP88_917 [Flaviaesturariibacter sp.]|nr:hypothetical protein [Flaviaesturariibacter sp.]